VVVVVENHAGVRRLASRRARVTNAAALRPLSRAASGWLGGRGLGRRWLSRRRLSGRRLSGRRLGGRRLGGRRLRGGGLCGRWVAAAAGEGTRSRNDVVGEASPDVNPDTGVSAYRAKELLALPEK
jgi:hypothetical protein